MSTTDISIILPVGNQEDHIKRICESYLEALHAGFKAFEIILVTNGTIDNSPHICQTLSQTHPQVRHLHIEEKGWGRAVRVGLREASGKIICYTNSARTSPEILSTCLKYAQLHGGTVVKANRKIRDSLTRRLGSLIYNLECRALFDLPCWDINGTPKVFPRSFAKLLALSRNDDLIDAEFLAVCKQEGYPIIEVPVLTARRHGGKSTTNYISAYKMYTGAFAVWRQMAKNQTP